MAAVMSGGGKAKGTIALIEAAGNIAAWASISGQA